MSVISKRILFIHHTPGYGGAYKSVLNYSSVLRNSGHIVEVAFYNSDSNEKAHFISNFNSSVLKRISQILFLIKFAYNFKPDVIIGLMPVNSLISLIVGRILRITVIGSERGDPYSHNGFVDKLKQRALSLCDIIIFQTLGARDFYLNNFKGYSHIIPNSVEPSLNPISYSNKNNVITFFGRFDLRNKRLDILFEVFKKLSYIYPNLQYHVFGNGDNKELSYVKNKCSDEQLVNRVSLFGVSNNVYHEMEKSRFFILTSDSEGMPNSLLEAMACGMICISTDCSPGGASEIIENGISGYIVPRGDVDALVESVVKVISDPSHGEILSRNARKRAAHFNKENLSTALQTIISGL